MMNMFSKKSIDSSLHARMAFEFNGDGIYSTRAWTKFGEGQFRFTTKGNVLYAISMKWSEQPMVIAAITPEAIKVTVVTMLGHEGKIMFSQDEQGLKITFPTEKQVNMLTLSRLKDQA